MVSSTARESSHRLEGYTTPPPPSTPLNGRQAQDHDHTGRSLQFFCRLVKADGLFYYCSGAGREMPMPDRSIGSGCDESFFQVSQ